MKNGMVILGVGIQLFYLPAIDLVCIEANPRGFDLVIQDTITVLIYLKCFMNYYGAWKHVFKPSKTWLKFTIFIGFLFFLSSFNSMKLII